MEFGMDKLWEVVEQLMRDIPRDEWDTYEIPSAPKDHKVRFGLKRTPLTKSLEVTKIIAVLHSSKLRIFGFVTELIVRMASGCLQWGAGRIPEYKKNRLEKMREEWKGKFLGPLIGFRHRKAPNQITGPLVDQFFSQSNKNKVIQSISELSGWKEAYRREMTDKEKNNFMELFQRLSVIGRVVLSGRLIHVLKFRKFCLECYIFILSTWSWCLLAESLHRLLGHTWEMIILNMNHGLLAESEQGSESSHKEERYA